MKAILLSVRPEYALNIMNGTKPLELRKTIPHDFKGWVYVCVTKGKPHLWSYGHIKENSDWEWETVYQTTQPFHARFSDKLNGKVVARFWFDEYIAYKYYADDNTYFAKRPEDFGWNAEEVLKRLCLTRDEFKDYGKGKDLYAWHIKKLDIFDKPMELKDFMFDAKVWNQAYQAFEEVPRELHRATQSWQYVEVKRGIE